MGDLFNFNRTESGPMQGCDGNRCAFGFKQDADKGDIGRVATVRAATICTYIEVLSRTVTSLPVRMCQCGSNKGRVIYSRPLCALLRSRPGPRVVSFIFERALVDRLLV